MILNLPAQLGHGGVDGVDHDIDLLLGDDEGRDEAEDVAGGAVDEHLVVLEAEVHHGLAALLGELDAVDQAQAADLLDGVGVVLLDDFMAAIAEVLADLGAVVQDALVEHDVQGGHLQGAGQGAAGEGGAVGAGGQGVSIS